MSRRTLLFTAAVALQILVLIAMPARQAYTRATGRNVVLKVQPVDPYNVFGGYYVNLSYDISSRKSFPDVPELTKGETVYAVIEQLSDGSWQPVSLNTTVPRNLSPNQVFIEGRVKWGRIYYGIEEFYIPEEKREEIEESLQKSMDQARVEVKVDSSGKAVLVRLRIDDRVYE